MLTYYFASVIEVTEGLLDSRCELSDPRSLSGKVLLLNTSSLRCKMLIKEKNFIKKLENSEVSALVILDDTPRYLEFGNFLQFFMGNVGSVKKNFAFCQKHF